MAFLPFLFFVLPCVLFVPFARAEVTLSDVRGIVISEVNWAGSPVSTADEWLELINSSDGDIDLNGWSITTRKSDGSDEVMILFEDILLRPRDVLLIGNYGAEASALAVHPHIVTTAVSLPNTKLYLQLRDAGGALVDAVDDGIGAPFAGSNAPHSSMERIDRSVPGTLKENWRTASVSIGFDAGVIVFGTPGLIAEDADGTEVSSIGSGSVFSSVSSGTSIPSAPSVPSTTSIIRITEALLNPAGNEDYEWIELGNLGDTPIDIAGWEIRDSSSKHIIIARNASGYVLAPEEHALFFRYQTGLSLSNAGEVITLFSNGIEIDRIDISETGEGISFGRTEDGSRAAFCVPTPREKNERTPSEFTITVQSGRTTDYTKVTLNLEAMALKGTLNNATCFWNFRDGTTSSKCNPPSHTLNAPGVYDITLTVKTYCGEEIERHLEAVVLLKKGPRVPTGPTSATSVPSVTSVTSVPSVTSVTSVPSVLSLPSETSKSLEMSSRKSRNQYVSSSSEQKIYSSKSSQVSSQKITDLLPIDYINVRYSENAHSEDPYPESPIDDRIYALMEANMERSASEVGRSENGFPWFLLFMQSVLWLVLAGRKMI